jgi:2,5-dihydroxypyridine 5,6-dioxygenase
MAMLPSAIRSQEVNPANLTRLFRQQFELCKVKPGETVAIVSDISTRRDYIHAAFAAADELSADIYEMCVNALPTWTKVGVPTIGKCKGTLDALMLCDMIVIFHVPLFSAWLKQVRDNKVRVQMIIDAPDDLEQLQSPPGLKEAILYSDRIYRKAKLVRVTSAAGTEFTYACGEFPVMSQYGMADEPGRFDHWGAGQIHTFPNEGSATGRVVFQPGDVIILPYCRYVQDEVRLEIEGGHITRIQGGLDATLMREWLKEGEASAGDRDPYAVSHVGWGLNPQSRWDSVALYGDAPERSRAAARSFPGNFLFSTGPNTQGGGKRSTRGHYDVPMRGCTVSLDGEIIINEGRVVDPKMIVARVPR